MRPNRSPRAPTRNRLSSPILRRDTTQIHGNILPSLKRTVRRRKRNRKPHTSRNLPRQGLLRHCRWLVVEPRLLKSNRPQPKNPSIRARQRSTFRIPQTLTQRLLIAVQPPNPLRETQDKSLFRCYRITAVLTLRHPRTLQAPPVHPPGWIHNPP